MSRLRVTVLVAAMVSAACLAADGGSAAALSPVDTLSDNAADGYTLREAVADANATIGPDTITFVDGLSGEIDLSAGPLLISDSVTIVGPGADVLGLSGGNAGRIITAGAAAIDLNLVGLSFVDGDSGAAGGAVAFIAAANLSLTDVRFENNLAATAGGALYVSFITGDVVMNDVRFVGNAAMTGAGASIESIGGDLEMSDVRFSDNVAQVDGGGLLAADVSGMVALVDVVAESNAAAAGVGGGVLINGVGGDVELERVDLTSNEAVQGGGGGIVEVMGAITASNATVENNRAVDEVGGLRCESAGDISVADSRIVGNEATTGDFGALDLKSSARLVVERTTLDGNTAPLGFVGGIRGLASSDMIVDGLAAADNSAAQFGGAMLAHSLAHVSISNSTFTENGAIGAFAGGGAVSISAVSVSVADSEFVGNTATGGGALFIDVADDSAIERSTFADNTAAGGGGAIWFTSTSDALDIRNSTFSGNEAGVSAAVAQIEATLVSLDNSTVVGNTAGGAEATFDDSGASSISYSNSILAQNSGAVTNDLSSVAISARQNSIFQNTTGAIVAPGNNLDNVDPLVGPLADNGGPTRTHRPAYNSPAIDAGDPVAFVASGGDQRGFARVVEIIDIGAVELQSDDRPLWIPLTPARLLDTRTNGATVDGVDVGGGRQPAGRTRSLQITGRAGVPAGARGVIVNVTAVNPVSTGFLTMHACLDDTPNTSSLNYTAGANLGNEVLVDLDDTGALCVYTEAETNVTIDVVGFVPAVSPLTTIPPSRYADSRANGVTFDGERQSFGRTAAGSITRIPVVGRGAVPADAAAVMVNLTAVSPQTNGYLTAYECLAAAPNASSLNHVSGVNRGNEIVVQPDTDGDICVFTSQAVHFTVDVVAYVPADADYSPSQPGRLLDTRDAGQTVDGLFVGNGRLAGGETLELSVGGRATLPDGASGTVILNVTAVSPATTGFATVWDCAGERPNASSLNFATGVNGGNQIIASLPTSGSICLYTSSPTHLTVDVSGRTTVVA